MHPRNLNPKRMHFFASPPLSQTKNTQSVHPPNLNPERMHFFASKNSNTLAHCFHTSNKTKKQKRKSISSEIDPLLSKEAFRLQLKATLKQILVCSIKYSYC